MLFIILYKYYKRTSTFLGKVEEKHQQAAFQNLTKVLKNSSRSGFEQDGQMIEQLVFSHKLTGQGCTEVGRKTSNVSLILEKGEKFLQFFPADFMLRTGPISLSELTVEKFY